MLDSRFNWSAPVGVEVSMFISRILKPTPLLFNSSTLSKMFLSERPNLERVVTTKTSPSLANSIADSNSGLFDARAETSSAYIFSHPSFSRSSIWCSKPNF